ncbi:hypothetical protein AB1N83_011289 [Pleurotus pulmonarius]
MVSIASLRQDRGSSAAPLLKVVSSGVTLGTCQTHKEPHSTVPSLVYGLRKKGIGTEQWASNAKVHYQPRALKLRVVPDSLPSGQVSRWMNGHRRYHSQIRKHEAQRPFRLDAGLESTRLGKSDIIQTPFESILLGSCRTYMNNSRYSTTRPMGRMGADFCCTVGNRQQSVAITSITALYLDTAYMVLK